MSFTEEVIQHLKGKQVIIVTNLESDGYLQEIAGILLSGGSGYLTIQQSAGETPTVINTSFVGWVYEETDDVDDEE